MKLFNKLIILIFYICFSSAEAFSESFKLTCDFGSSWNKFTPKVQTHIIINDKVYFEDQDKKSYFLNKTENKIIWAYEYPVDKKLYNYADKNLYSRRAVYKGIGCNKKPFPTQYFEYTFFTSSNKINIDNKRTRKLKPHYIGSGLGNNCTIEEQGWGTCKREPLDQATLAKYSKPKPSGNNTIVSEYNKVLENKLQEVERKSKDLENKLAALQSQKKEINQSIAEKKDIGSGFYVSKFRHIVTNQHVVNQCNKITVGNSINTQIPADLIASDKKNDLAVLQTISMEMASTDTKSFVQKLSIQVVPILSGGLMRSEDVVGGEQIYIAGYPLGNMVSDQMKLGDGIVSATKGMDNDVSQFIVSSDIKRGNSGGPVYDSKGNVVGVAVSRLNVNRTDTINFAIKGSTVKQFLSAHNVPTKWSNRKKNITTQDLYKIASKQTVMVVCHR